MGEITLLLQCSDAQAANKLTRLVYGRARAAGVLPHHLVALNDALEKFAGLHPEKAELVKLRYFPGFSIDETAQMLGVSLTTAKRWWAFARAWLFDEVSGNVPRDA